MRNCAQVNILYTCILNSYNLQALWVHYKQTRARTKLYWNSSHCYANSKKAHWIMCSIFNCITGLWIVKGNTGNKGHSSCPIHLKWGKWNELTFERMHETMMALMALIALILIRTCQRAWNYVISAVERGKVNASNSNGEW